MSDTLVKMKTGTLANIESETNGQLTVPLDKGSIYFAIDLQNHVGKIVYDAPTDSTPGVDRIVMSTQADRAAFSEGIPYGIVDSTSTATEFTATVPGITELKDGTIVLLKNGVVTSASGFTININNLGAKPVYNNLTAATRDTTIFNINYTMLFIYDSTRVSGGGWICYRGYDANTNTIGYQVRSNYGTLPAADKGYRYRLWFTSADGTKWVPANTSTSTNATAKRTPNTRPIDPFGPIIYYNYNGTTEANAKLSVEYMWQQFNGSLGYSFNTTGAALTLTKDAPVYIQCTPQTNGSAVLNGYTQTLPSANDGKIYIFLGIAFSAVNVELRLEHPVYYHDGTGIRIWNGGSTPALFVNMDLTQGFFNNSISFSDVDDAMSESIPVYGIDNDTGEILHVIKYSPNDYITFKSFTNIVTVNYNEEFTISSVEDIPQTEPIFTKSAAYNITSTNINKWNQAEQNIQSNWNETNTSSDAYIQNKPTNVSAFTNDAGYLTSADIPEGASAYTGTISAVGTTASAGTNNGFARGDHVHNITGSTITSALGYTPYNSTNPNGYTSNTGTVTSVRVQATSPVQSSTSTAQAGSLDTTISLANGYGDTKNPYNTKTANYVLAGPSSGSAAAPTFRKLTSADIPDLSSKYLTSYTETDPVFTASPAHGITSANITAWNNKQNALTPGTGISISNNTISTTAEANVQSNWTETNTSSDAYIKNKPTNVSSFTNDAGYLTSYTETDPVFTASAAHGITSSNITAWNAKMNTPSGGTAGQILTKTASGYGWADASGGSGENPYAWHSSTGMDQGTHLTYNEREYFEETPAGTNILVSSDKIQARMGDVPSAEISFVNSSFTLGSRLANSTIGDGSYAEGSLVVSSGTDSHAEGYRSAAIGNYSHAQNMNTIANGNYQTAIGKNNIADTTNALIIGNGADTLNRSNALTVDWNGNVNAAGAINGTNTVFTDVRNTQRSLPDLATSIITGYRTTIYATSWSSDKVEYYGKYWYKYDLAFNDLNKNLITSVPIIGISGADEYTPPTDAEQEAYDTWEYAFADTYNNSINFISEVKPTSDFSVIILGVI